MSLCIRSDHTAAVRDIDQYNAYLLDRDSVIFSRRKADGAREKLDGVRLLHAELKEQTGGLQAKVRFLEAGLAVINR